MTQISNIMLNLDKALNTQNSLNINMGNYYILLGKISSNFYKIILLWVK